MDDFYVTLPSNVPNAPFSNTSSRYVTRLPEVLHMKRDEWMVALTYLVYPHSFVNVGKPFHYWIHFKSNRNPIRLTFPSAHYKDLSHIVSTLNREKATRLKRSAVEDIISESLTIIKRQANDDQELIDFLNEEEENKEEGKKEDGNKKGEDKEKPLSTTVIPAQAPKVSDAIASPGKTSGEPKVTTVPVF